MKRLLLTTAASLALLTTAHAQTVAPPAKAHLASEQTPFPAAAKPAVDAGAAGTSAHNTLASDSPAPSAQVLGRPAAAPAGEAAGAPAPASPASLDALPSNQGLR